MNEFIAGVTQAAVETFDMAEPVLEVGSYLVEGQEHIANLRTLLAGRAFTGMDMRPGPGVDQVANVEALPFADDSFSTIFALNTFEHVERFWLGIAELKRVLRPDGLLVVSMPFHFRIHDYPYDYWRFTPQALRSLLSDLPNLIIGGHGSADRPIDVWAVAAGAAHTPFTPELCETFRTKIQQYARHRQSAFRMMRYRLGRLICGRRPFRTYFEAERFDLELVQSTAAMRRAA
jgi:SAM-dependent methyltransferase